MKKSVILVILAGLLLSLAALAACSAIPKVGFRVPGEQTNGLAGVASTPIPSDAAGRTQIGPEATSAIEPIKAAPKEICPTCPAAPTCPGAATATSAVNETDTPVPSATNTPTATYTSTATASSTATATQTATALPTATNTNTPTALPTATATGVPSRTPTAAPTDAGRPYAVQAESPKYLANFAHTDLACNWEGIAGQVFSNTGAPVSNIVVIAEGSYNGKTLDEIALTGLNSAYGPGGFEIKIGTAPLATTNSVFLTIYDLNGTPLTYPLNLATYADCSKNLIIVNFKQR
jgi:hypothetical protein